MSDQVAMDIPKPRSRKPPALTESELIGLLRLRYEQDSQGNGVSGGVIPGVRNQAGFDASRTIDAIAMHYWPSRGLLIDAIECKSSRSDFKRELEDCAKADAFCKLVDRFYIVIGRDDIAKPGELPPDWGLLVPTKDGKKLREVKHANVLHADSPAIEKWAQQASGGRRAAGPRPLPPGFNRSFVTALLRQALVQRDVRNDLLTARDEGYRAGTADGERFAKHELERLRQLKATVDEFQAALGYPIHGHRQFLTGRDITIADIGKTLRAVLDGDANVQGLRNQLSAAANAAERLAEEARRRVEQLDAALSPEREGTAAS